MRFALLLCFVSMSVALAVHVVDKKSASREDAFEEPQEPDITPLSKEEIMALKFVASGLQESALLRALVRQWYSFVWSTGVMNCDDANIVKCSTDAFRMFKEARLIIDCLPRAAPKWIPDVHDAEFATCFQQCIDDFSAL